MSNVTLQIGGRSYVVACAAGEEEHVVQLGEVIDAKARELGASSHNELRLLLFVALLLADELSEARGRAAPAPPPEAAARPAPDHAEALEKLADRLEKYAASLEG